MPARTLMEIAIAGQETPEVYWPQRELASAWNWQGRWMAGWRAPVDSMADTAIMWDPGDGTREQAESWVQAVNQATRKYPRGTSLAKIATDLGLPVLGQ